MFVEPVYWDGLRKGLLCGERLALDLRRMEVAQLDHDRRELELTKRVSLRLLDPAALLRLRETGTCEVSIPEVAFDLDHPGHYFRRLKTVSLSIPAVAGPHVSVGATLTLLGHETRISAALGAGYARNGTEDLRFRDEAPGEELQSIATSRGRDDAGMFELQLRDERYLPFEGAGAVSSWRIELPTVRQFDYRTIADVELELRYTARDGGVDLRNAASGAVETAIEAVVAAGNAGGFWVLLSATKDFATEWERLLRPAEGQGGEPLALPIVTERFPYVLRSRGIEVDEVRMVFVAESGAVSVGPTDVELSHVGGPTTVGFQPVVVAPPAPHALVQGTASFASAPIELDEMTNPWELALPPGFVVDPDRVHDLWVLVRYHVTNA